MIILFYVTDPSGTERCLSAVCGPSTTAAGAVNLFRTRVGVPNAVRVEVQLENRIPIRHQTAPLTSLRKQRGGIAQVMQIHLWVTLSGEPSAIAEIQFNRLEVAHTDDNEDEEEAREDEAAAGVKGADDDLALEEMGPSWTARGERRSSGAARIVKERSYSTVGRAAAAAAPEGGNAAITATNDEPQTARRVSPAVSVRIAMPAPVTARGARHADPGDTQALRKSSVSPTEEGVERVRKSKPAPHDENRSAPSAATARFGSGDASTPAPNAETKPATRPAVFTLLADRDHTVRRDCHLAQIMMREYPKLIDPSDSKQIVQVVHDDDRLRAMAYDEALVVPSAIAGLSDAEYSHCLSAGLVNGIETRSATLGHRIALYSVMNTLRHSCWPNAAVHVDLYTEPHSASCRCAVIGGLRNGDPITYLYRHADSQPFMLLSRDRRQNLLRKRYFFDCECARCRAGAGPSEKEGVTDEKAASRPPLCVPAIPKSTLDAESTLTGCFFTDSSIDKDHEKQAAISEEMRQDFDALQIMSDDGLEITLTVPGNVPPVVRTKHCNQLLQFMRKYGSAASTLRLHEHHWRLNMVRAAYIQETVRLCAVKGVTPEIRRLDPENRKLFTPTRTVYDLCLKQLAVESIFIPAGHPHTLTTYESFQFLVSILPPSLAGAVMQQARATSRINWEQLQKTKQTWGTLKHTSPPPPLVQSRAAAAAVAGNGVGAVRPEGPTAAKVKAAVTAVTRDSAAAPKPTVKRHLPNRVAVEKNIEKGTGGA